MGMGALGNQVVDVIRPVLNCRVPNLGTRQRDYFNYRDVKRICGVDWGRAVVDRGAARQIGVRRAGHLEVVRVALVRPALDLADRHPEAISHRIEPDVLVAKPFDEVYDIRLGVAYLAPVPHRFGVRLADVDTCIDAQPREYLD